MDLGSKILFATAAGEIKYLDHGATIQGLSDHLVTLEDGTTYEITKVSSNVLRALLKEGIIGMPWCHWPHVTNSKGYIAFLYANRKWWSGGFDARRDQDDDAYNMSLDPDVVAYVLKTPGHKMCREITMLLRERYHYMRPVYDEEERPWYWDDQRERLDDLRVKWVPPTFAPIVHSDDNINGEWVTFMRAKAHS